MNKQDESGLLAALGGGVDFERRTIYIIGPITHETSTRVIPAIRTMDATKGDIRVILDSGGGSEPEGFAIYDVLRLANNHVTIDCYGAVQSIAALVLQAADRRRMSPECRFMVHNGTVETPGAIHQGTFIAIARESDYNTKRYQQILADRTGQLGVLDLEGFCHDEACLSAAECLEFGFIDEVIDSAAKTEVQKTKKKATKGQIAVQVLAGSAKKRKK